MRRALVVLRRGSAALLFIMAVGLGVLWPRTGRVGDSVNYVTRGDTLYAVETVPGGLSFARSTHEMAVKEGYPDECRPGAGWSMRSIVWNRFFVLEPPDQLKQPGVIWNVISTISPPTAGRMGFCWSNDRDWYSSAFAPYSVQVEQFRLTVPLWFAIAILATPAVWSLFRSWRKRWRKRAGFCAVCGYDLRATPERCPECGRATGVGPAVT